MKTKPRTWTAWGVRWESKNSCHLIGSANVMHPVELEGCTGSLMFSTRKACREYIEYNYAHILLRKDLRSEPHGWRMPKAVRIEVTVKEK